MYSGPSPFSALDFPELTAFTNVAGPGSCLVYNGSGHLALQPHGSGSMTVQSDEADSDSEDEEEVGSRQAAADMETTFGENEEEEEGSELGSEPVQLYAIPPKGRRAALVPASDFQQHVDSAKQELAATADAVPSDEDFLERLAIVKARYCMDATLANGQQAPALLDQQKLSAQQSAFVEVMRCQAEHRVELSSAAANPAKETTKLWRYLAGQPITKADILEYIKLAELALVMTPGSVEEERMFSDMAYLKDDTRNRLQECHLNYRKLAGVLTFVVVGQQDHPIYEADLTGPKEVSWSVHITSTVMISMPPLTQSPDSCQQQQAQYLHQFVLHAALDAVDEAMWMTKEPYLKTVDRFNNLLVTAFVTPGNARFLLLHDGRNEESMRNFFLEAYELYIKVILNPLQQPTMRISNREFDRKIRLLAKRFFN
ncbi:hypothetical protein QJQ45_021582 [Haematococcus lacustris]|nr:hypothetical protein QJQ45_021582 [Haematococcus lacustris]